MLIADIDVLSTALLEGWFRTLSAGGARHLLPLLSALGTFGEFHRRLKHACVEFAGIVDFARWCLHQRRYYVANRYWIDLID